MGDCVNGFVCDNSLNVFLELSNYGQYAHVTRERENKERSEMFAMMLMFVIG